MNKQPPMADGIVPVRESRKLSECGFPSCTKKAIKKSQYGLCFKHDEMFDFILWTIGSLQDAAEKIQQQDVKGEQLWKPK